MSISGKVTPTSVARLDRATPFELIRECAWCRLAGRLNRGGSDARFLLLTALIVSALMGPIATAADSPPATRALVEDMRDDAIDNAEAIWQSAELGYLETDSSQLLARHLRRNGFDVDTGVADLPTAVRSHCRKRRAGHRHPCGIRRAAGTVASSRARAGTHRGGCAGPCLRPPSVRLGVRNGCDRGGTVAREVGPLRHRQNLRHAR